MYTFQSQVRYSELDSDRKLSIASIVDYFQDCSTFHSESLGVGIDYLDRVGMLWVMSYWQIVIDRYPGLCEKITIGTFPYEFRGFLGYRNFFIADETGKKIVRANSLWTLMDIRAGRPAKPTRKCWKPIGWKKSWIWNMSPARSALTVKGRSIPLFMWGSSIWTAITM